MGTAILAGQRVSAVALNALPPDFLLTTGNVSNSIAETVIGTFNIPGNDPVASGGYDLRVVGTCDDTATPGISIRLRLTNATGTQLALMGPITCRTTVTNMYYSINASLMFEQVGASGILDTDTTFKEALAATTKASHFDGVTGTAIDTTQPIVVVVTAIWGTASVSNVARTLVGSLRRL